MPYHSASSPRTGISLLQLNQILVKYGEELAFGTLWFFCDPKSWCWRAKEDCRQQAAL